MEIFQTHWWYYCEEVAHSRARTTFSQPPLIWRLQTKQGRERDGSILLGAGGDRWSTLLPAGRQTRAAQAWPLAHLGSLVTHLCVVLPEGAQAACAWEPGPHSGVQRAHPVSWPLPPMNEESFRQSVLSICSLQICINSISDVMTWSSPTYASSVCRADVQRTLTIWMVSGWANEAALTEMAAYGMGSTKKQREKWFTAFPCP